MIKTARQLKDLIRNLSREKSADAIAEIRFSISSTLTLAPFTVASKSIVERASSPTIAATSIPPFRINLSRYSEREIRSRKRSII